MKAIFGGFGLAVIAVAVILAFSAFYIVDERQQALVLQFGETKQVVRQPGLKFKIPFIQDAVYIDKHILDLDSPSQEVIASGQKRLVVDAFARYRVIDPLLFYQRLSTIENANSRMSVLLNSAVRRVLGGVSFENIVSQDRGELMGTISQQVNTDAEQFGLEVVDVRIRRADLPEANSQAIFNRMQTERQREATEIRAQGAEAAQRITARADRDVTVLVAEANRESEQVRGEGDATRNRIFAEAYTQDPDFFAFYRSMRAYEESFKPADTRMVISPKSDFFRYFSDPSGGVAPGGDRAVAQPRDGEAADGDGSAAQPRSGPATDGDGSVAQQ
jgi:modulator of FtsH protease HflC